MNTESKELLGTAYQGTTSTDSKDLSKVLFGALAGAAAGSIIGVFFTEKGIETRKRVGEGSRNIAKNFKDKVADIKENIADKVADIKENIADKYAATKEGAADLIEKGKQKVGMSSGNTAYRGTTGDDEDNSGSKVLLGALVAAVAGAVIWSFATEKGTETRNRLGKGSKDIANNLKEKLSDIADNIADKYQAAKEGAADLVEKAKQQNNVSSGNTAYRGSTSADTLES
ncbi:MAG TPA: YtxH domain-containing protein [Segetibacter sp.]